MSKAKIAKLNASLKKAKKVYDSAGKAVSKAQKAFEAAGAKVTDLQSKLDALQPKSEEPT